MFTNTNPPQDLTLMDPVLFSEAPSTDQASTPQTPSTSTILNGREFLLIEFECISAPAPQPYGPLAYHTLPDDHLLAHQQECLEAQVKDILIANNVNPINAGLFLRKHRDRCWEQGIPTIRVLANKLKDNEPWIFSIGAIRGYLRTLELGHMVVEFLNPKWLREIRTYPTESSDPIEKEWEEGGLGKVVMQIIMTAGIDWRSVDVLRLAYEEDDRVGGCIVTTPVPTIAITISFETKVEECEEPRRKIVAALDARKLEGAVVDFAYG
jgi:hypothetical protein